MLLVDKTFSDFVRPEPIVTISEWADNHRMLSSKSSSEPGKWKTSRTPYLREIMDELSPCSPTQRIVFMAGAQVGKTECGNNWLGAIMHLFPGPVLAIQPTVDIAMRFSKQRIATLIEESNVLRDKVKPPRARDSGNTLFSKEFPGGVLMITGSNSAAGLRSMPIKYLFADEVDAWPADVEGEGDPLSLAERRTITFPRRKIFICSTPTLKDSSRIEREYLQTDQRRYFVPCPYCQHKQVLTWKNLKWTDYDPNTAAYECENCHKLIQEHHKSYMLTNGLWMSTVESNTKAIGFHINSLYSPLGWKSWKDIVEEFLRVKNDAPSLKTWVNTILGETFEEDYANKIGVNILKDRAEFYDTKCLPNEIILITMGIDVQDNRIALLSVGWGKGEEAWILDHNEIYGDPSKTDLYTQIDNIIKQPYIFKDGRTQAINIVAIDSGGHFTHEVYQYAKERKQKGIIAIKGQSQKNKQPIGKPTKIDINFKGQFVKNGGLVYPVGTDTIKTTLFGRLTNNDVGEGYIHFHTNLTDEFYNQLISEKKQIRYVKGFPIYEWVKKSTARNEALDCFVYAYAALNHLYQIYDKKTIFEQFVNKRTKIVTKPDKVNNINNPSFVEHW